MPEYRCTRERPYTNDCPGRRNKQARQGHYIDAEDELDARGQMCLKFPNDNGWFTIDAVDALDKADKVEARIMGMSRRELEDFYYVAVTLLYQDDRDVQWNHDKEWSCVDICADIASLIHADVHHLVIKATPDDS